MEPVDWSEPNPVIDPAMNPTFVFLAHFFSQNELSALSASLQAIPC